MLNFFPTEIFYHRIIFPLRYTYDNVLEVPCIACTSSYLTSNYLHERNITFLVNIIYQKKWYSQIYFNMDYEIEQNNETNNLRSIMDPVNTSWIFSTIILIGVIMLLIFFLCIVVFLYNQNQSKLKKFKASTLSLNQEIISLRKNNNEAWIIINRQQRKLRDQRNSE